MAVEGGTGEHNPCAGKLSLLADTADLHCNKSGGASRHCQLTVAKCCTADSVSWRCQLAPTDVLQCRSADRLHSSAVEGGSANWQLVLCHEAALMHGMLE
jgi:hypothetical protein